jgi:2,3-bisphosphoglycerate-independent phosphoglycerate mutase
LIDFISDKKNVKISSISGRYFAMDRDNNWERIQKSYDAILGKIEKSDKDPVAYLKQSYSDKVFDEFIEPIYFVSGKAFESGDVFLHYNYRSDRATQLTKIIEKDF